MIPVTFNLKEYLNNTDSVNKGKLYPIKWNRKLYREVISEWMCDDGCCVFLLNTLTYYHIGTVRKGNTYFNVQTNLIPN